MGVIVSVNVGLPQDVAWQGRTVRTAVWKTPVTGRIFARRLNLDGDGQADLRAHGGEQRALLVYQLESYRYWASYLGRSDLVAGNFGENLTVEGLADNEVCIGDRFQDRRRRRRGQPAARHLLPGRHQAATSGRYRRCWSRTAGPVSISASSRKARSAPAIASRSSPTAPSA